ncbi:uncharacterized protein LOC144626401 [Crassostrea virginica]
MKSHSANSPVVQTSTPASVRHCERCLPGHSEHPSTRCRDVYVSTVQNVVGTVEKRVSLFVRDSCVKAATLRKRNQRERQRIKRENARIRKQRERELKSKLNKLNELKRRKKSEAQKNQRHKKVAPEKKKQSNIGHY